MADLAAGSLLTNVGIAASSAIDPNAVSLPAPNGTGVLTGATAALDTMVATSADLSVTRPTTSTRWSPEPV